MTIQEVASDCNVLTNPALNKVVPISLGCCEPLHKRSAQVREDRHHRIYERRGHAERIRHLSTIILRLCHNLLYLDIVLPPARLTEWLRHGSIPDRCGRSVALDKWGRRPTLSSNRSFRRWVTKDASTPQRSAISSRQEARHYRARRLPWHGIPDRELSGRQYRTSLTLLATFARASVSGSGKTRRRPLRRKSPNYGMKRSSIVGLPPRQRSGRGPFWMAHVRNPARV